ncbi:hypothetical protein MNBD_GAMMA20-134, partial [hydrothermal vent metagenome]
QRHSGLDLESSGFNNVLDTGPNLVQCPELYTEMISWKSQPRIKGASPMPAQINISLSEPERVELEKVVFSQMTPVRLVERAKAILMAADNIPSYKIAEHFDVDNNTIGRWRRRYAEHRMAGIVKDRPRGAN